jgi:putative membrane protein
MAAVPEGYELTPYCGAPPSPLTLLTRWNLDPVLIIALLAVLLAYVIASRKRPGGSEFWRKPCFYAGWLVGALALTSPLCPLSVSVFSARVGQHMLLTSIVAPLVVLGCGHLKPSIVATDRVDDGRGVLLAALAFMVALWVWHAPGPYMATFTSDLGYWAMHFSVFGAACWLWAGLLDLEGRHPLASLAAAMLTTVQMGFLGAFITFAPKPLYAAHTLTTVAWGLTPLQDQQLGGAIMWIPAGAILVGAIVLSLGRAIRLSEARAWTHTAG